MGNTLGGLAVFAGRTTTKWVGNDGIHSSVRSARVRMVSPGAKKTGSKLTMRPRARRPGRSAVPVAAAVRSRVQRFAAVKKRYEERDTHLLRDGPDSLDILLSAAALVLFIL